MNTTSWKRLNKPVPRCGNVDKPDIELGLGQYSQVQVSVTLDFCPAEYQQLVILYHSDQ